VQQKRHYLTNLQLSHHRGRCHARERFEKEVKESSTTLVSNANVAFASKKKRVILEDSDEDAAATVLGEDNSGIERVPFYEEKVECLERLRKMGALIPPRFKVSELLLPDFHNRKYWRDGNTMAHVEYHKHNSTDKGAAYLVCHSSFGAYSPQQKVDSREIELQLNIATLLMTLSRGQRDLFAEIVDGIVTSQNRRNISQVNSPNSTFVFPRIPTTAELMRKQFTKGKNAMFEIIPRPRTIKLKNHTIGCLVSIVRDFLAHGIPCKGVASPEWVLQQSTNEEFLRNDKRAKVDDGNM
jgi:hypothetical protein